MKIENCSHKRSHKLKGIVVVRIGTFPFLLILFMTPLLNYDLVKTRLSEAEAEEPTNWKARNRILSLVYSASACDSDNAVFT